MIDVVFDAPPAEVARLLPITIRRAVAREWRRRKTYRKGDAVVGSTLRDGIAVRALLRRRTFRVVLPFPRVADLYEAVGSINDEPVGPWPAGSVLLGRVAFNGTEDYVRAIVAVDLMPKGFDRVIGEPTGDAFPFAPL